MRQSQREASFTENVSFEASSNAGVKGHAQRVGNHQKQEKLQLVNDVRA